MTEKEKLFCPILSAPRTHNAYCMKERCALWIKVQKPLDNPFTRLVYEGCGLVKVLPWRLEKTDIAG